jgi:hypothetical protein
MSIIQLRQIKPTERSLDYALPRSLVDKCTPLYEIYQRNKEYAHIKQHVFEEFYKIECSTYTSHDVCRTITQLISSSQLMAWGIAFNFTKYFSTIVGSISSYVNPGTAMFYWLHGGELHFVTINRTDVTFTFWSNNVVIHATNQYVDSTDGNFHQVVKKFGDVLVGCNNQHTVSLHDTTSRCTKYIYNYNNDAARRSTIRHPQGAVEWYDNKNRMVSLDQLADKEFIDGVFPLLNSRSGASPFLLTSYDQMIDSTTKLMMTFDETRRFNTVSFTAKGMYGDHSVVVNYKSRRFEVTQDYNDCSDQYNDTNSCNLIKYISDGETSSMISDDTGYLQESYCSTIGSTCYTFEKSGAWTRRITRSTIQTVRNLDTEECISQTITQYDKDVIVGVISKTFTNKGTLCERMVRMSGMDCFQHLTKITRTTKDTDGREIVREQVLNQIGKLVKSRCKQQPTGTQPTDSQPTDYQYGEPGESGDSPYTNPVSFNFDFDKWDDEAVPVLSDATQGVEPEESQPIVGWKFLKSDERHVMAKLSIPHDALIGGISDVADRELIGRSKVRTHRVMIVELQELDGTVIDDRSVMAFSPISKDKLCYRAGRTIVSDKFDDKLSIQCSSGIHFFLNRQNVIDYIDHMIREGVVRDLAKPIEQPKQVEAGKSMFQSAVNWLKSF